MRENRRVDQQLLVFLLWAPIWVLMALGILADRRARTPQEAPIVPETSSALPAGLLAGLAPIPLMALFGVLVETVIGDPAFIGLVFLPLPVVAILASLDPHGPAWSTGFRFGLAVSLLAYPAYVVATTAAGRPTTIDALVVFALFAVTTAAAFFLGPTRRRSPPPG
jgi:hypothetical protein